MNDAYRIDIIDGITSIRFSKQPGMDEIRTAIDAAAELNPGGLRLWNLSSGILNLTSAQIQELADYAKSKFLPASKVAVVAPEDFTFGLSRMYSAFRDQEQLEIEVFRTEQEAHDWLIEKVSEK